MKLESSTSFWIGIALSVLLHVAVWATRGRRPETQEPAPPLTEDHWAASGVEVGAEPAARAAEPAAATATPASEPHDAPPPAAHEAAEVVQRPRPPSRPAPKPSAPTAKAPAPSSSASAPSSASEGATAAAQPGSMGAVELPPGVRHLAHAFARALPASNYADTAWTELPVGEVGRAELEIVVDEQGHITDVEFDPRFPKVAVIERMVKNCILLLKAGVFSLDARSVSAGSEHLALEVSLRDEPSPEADADPRGLFRKGYEAPTASRPGARTSR
ncbi:MAG: hypothetical protein QM756_40625 [Polyangiaceae bacterium]